LYQSQPADPLLPHSGPDFQRPLAIKAKPLLVGAQRRDAQEADDKQDHHRQDQFAQDAPPQPGCDHEEVREGDEGRATRSTTRTARSKTGDAVRPLAWRTYFGARASIGRVIWGYLP